MNIHRATSTHQKVIQNSRGVVGMCVHAKKHIHAKKAGKERGEGEERIVRGL